MELTQRQMDMVKAAIDIIANKGYEKLTTKNLAAEIGVTEAALYRHFKSKRELVTMVLSYFEFLSCEVLTEIRESNCAPVDCIRKFVLNRYELFSRNSALAKVMFSEELFKNDPGFTGQYQSIMHIHRGEVVAFIQKAQKEGSIDGGLDPTQLFRIIVGSMRLIVSQWNMCEGGFDLQAEGEALLETIIYMIEVRK
ncbi:MAG: TetR/AcrR family transcriptional regulator [Candidatus Cloacimonetes bacterium]|nr:TetR/AcrR family transcriptional regulator [Candidatus Cloacimonadota bacterium]